MMVDAEREETLSLQSEFEWVLHKEVHAVLNQLNNILVECLHRFPMAFNSDGPLKHEKFVLGGLDQLKCVVSLSGDCITHADVSFKVQRQQLVHYRSSILNENPWRLHQIQDSINHLNQAIVNIENIDKDYIFHSQYVDKYFSAGTNICESIFACKSDFNQVHNLGNKISHSQSEHFSLDTFSSTSSFKVFPSNEIHVILRSSEEVLHILGNILGCLQRGRTSLILPRKRTIDDLMKSRNMKCLVPSLPEDLAVSFYIQSHKLVFAVYQVTTIHGSMKFDTHQAEVSVPWLNEVLVLFTVALQLCQQLKDKISVFAQYKDFTVSSPQQPLPCAQQV